MRASPARPARSRIRCCTSMMFRQPVPGRRRSSRHPILFGNGRRPHGQRIHQSIETRCRQSGRPPSHRHALLAESTAYIGASTTATISSIVTRVRTLGHPDAFTSSFGSATPKAPLMMCFGMTCFGWRCGARGTALLRDVMVALRSIAGDDASSPGQGIRTMNRFEGKVAAVAGGASGIGQAVVPGLTRSTARDPAAQGGGPPP